jgi:E3 ubiquitin-protein ligase UBR4
MLSNVHISFKFQI